MGTIFLRVETKSLKEILEKAVQVLKEGGLVAFPTETFYGLAVDALNKRALLRLSRLKKRPSEKPFPLIIPDISWAFRLWEEPSSLLRRLIEAFWPGPLTIVAKAKIGLPQTILAPNGTVALRISSHPVALGLAKAFGGPITATSANPAEALPPTTADEVKAYFGESLDLILDAGKTEGGNPSTVILVQGEKIHLIRPGVIPLEKIFSLIHHLKNNQI
ncbi:L-threonylcarbamoyladenylate synthase [Thermosulfuriphilus sp.]